MIELISYNILNGKRLGEILAWVKKANPVPDIICFQEFPESKIAEFKEKLSEKPYSFEFAPAFSKKKTIFGELTVYNNSKLKLTDSEVVKLGESKLDRVVFRHRSHRTSLITTFKYNQTTFTVANVHLMIFALHRSRKRQLATTISQLNKKSPAIIVGDYNYSILMGRKRGLIKFMEEYGFKMAGQKVITHKIWRFPQQIDYAFYKDIKVLDLKVGKIKYSDHFPILVKFAI